VEPEPEGVIKPTHVAIVYIHELHSRLVESYAGAHGAAMSTSAVKSASAKQRDFIKSTQYAVVRHIEGARPFTALWLYAVSEDDARKMTRGVIEYITKVADRNVQVTKDVIPDRQGKIAEAKEQIPKSKRILETARENYQRAKKLSFYSSMDDNQVAGELRKTILEMSKMLDLIDVEIDVINAKIAAIEHFAHTGEFGGTATNSRRRQMMLEERVELAGAQTRREGVLKIKKREERLSDLLSRKTDASNKLDALERGLKKDEQALEDARESLANPGAYFQHPKIRGNKVVIYPVGE
jgi:hypothetical protein